MTTRQRHWFLICLLISVLIHISTFVSIQWFPLTPPKGPKEIEVTIIDKSKTQNLDGETPKQIVDQQEKSVNDEIPKDAKFLSRNNQTVKKETRAEANGAFANRDNGTPQPQQEAKPKSAQHPKPQVADLPKPTEKGPGKLPSLKDLTHKYTWSDETVAQRDGQGPSTNDDFLKDKEKGPETLLNTREFIYFSYYSRIKDRLRMYWEPKIKQKITRILAQGRKIASDQEHITRVVIHLDKSGTLIRVQIVSESGVRDLDDAAVEAFQAAAPFPNPPVGIVDADGTIKIRWDFVLEAKNTEAIKQEYVALQERRPSQRRMQ